MDLDLQPDAISLLTLYLDYTLGLLHCRAAFPKDLEWTTSLQV